MHRRHDAADLSAAAQEYLLALRVMAVDGSRVTAAQVGRHLGVSTQAASEMFRRLTADGLVAQAGVATGPDRRRVEPPRTASSGATRCSSGCWRRSSGWAGPNRTKRRHDCRAPSRRASRPGSTRCSAIPRPARTAIRSTPPRPGAARRRSPQSPGSRRTRDDLPDHRGGRGGQATPLLPRGPGPQARRAITVLARSESLDSITLEGPRGRATLGLRPAASSMPSAARRTPSLFHQVPRADDAARSRGN